MENRSQIFKQLIENYNFELLDKDGFSGERLASRIAAIAAIGQTADGGSNRIGFSKEEKQAKMLVVKWMEDAGLEVKMDGAGNVFGRLEGKHVSLPAILAGSHLDTVPNGGHFDGVIGVLIALEIVEAWRTTNYVPKYPYEVVIFTDEEGSRFGDGLCGSRALVGMINIEEQKQVFDDEGKSFEQVLIEDDLTIDSFNSAKRDLKEIEAFVEVHIEQGAVLENADLPVGIVSGIAGPCWLEITYRGLAGHAGSTPMESRKDALVAAGSLISQIPLLPRKVSQTAVATVGKIDVKPNGINVIPEEVTFTVDIRDIHQDSRDQLLELIIELARSIAAKNNLDCSIHEALKIEPTPLKEVMIEKFKKSVEALGIEPFILPSGAGHDAMILGRYVPTGMLFIRSKKGISHNPNEWSSLQDCTYAAHILKHFLENYKVKHHQQHNTESDGNR